MANETKQDPRAASEVDRLIGARIRARRLQLSMSQEVLAAAIGVTFQQVQKYERGHNRVSASTLIDIANALEIRITGLLPSASNVGDVAATPLDDPDIQEFGLLLMRLSREGRRVLASIARALAKDPKLGAPRGKRPRR